MRKFATARECSASERRRSDNREGVDDEENVSEESHEYAFKTSERDEPDIDDF
jgi:hypothetical protein